MTLEMLHKVALKESLENLVHCGGEDQMSNNYLNLCHEGEIRSVPRVMKCK